MLTIAVAKGRIQESLRSVFIAMGLEETDLDSRKLILIAPSGIFRLVFLKSIDIPTYVSQGSVDLGIVGKDVVLEAGLPVFEIESLDLATCRLCLAGPKDLLLTKKSLKIGTKYPAITQMIYEARGEKIETITLEGSVEIAPLIGLSDCIVDIVESGKTLKANDLVVYETLMDIFPLVVANTISYKTKLKEVKAWMTNFNAYLSSATLIDTKSCS